MPAARERRSSRRRRRAGAAAAADAEALRETIHEIKTPLNAIIGFAEIIDGQYLGPAHRNYRHRAAEIVAQARTLLAAIEDLDFAARLQARGPGDGAATDLADVLPPLAEELGNQALARDVRLRIVTSLGALALRSWTATWHAAAQAVAGRGGRCRRRTASRSRSTSARPGAG